jgi:hypothetical protein
VAISLHKQGAADLDEMFYWDESLERVCLVSEGSQESRHSKDFVSRDANNVWLVPCILAIL